MIKRILAKLIPNPNLTLTILEVLILRILPETEELYALEIRDRLPRRVHLGKVYVGLNRLEKKELIEWRWDESPQESGDRRRLYKKLPLRL